MGVLIGVVCALGEEMLVSMDLCEIQLRIACLGAQNDRYRWGHRSWYL
jgi:hypothetical protein